MISRIPIRWTEHWWTVTKPPRWLSWSVALISDVIGQFQNPLSYTMVILGMVKLRGFPQCLHVYLFLPYTMIVQSSSILHLLPPSVMAILLKRELIYLKCSRNRMRFPLCSVNVLLEYWLQVLLMCLHVLPDAFFLPIRELQIPTTGLPGSHRHPR